MKGFMTGLVSDIQRFSIHDGPGIRTTVFLKGCNLRCAWCHNPETLSARPEIQTFPDKCIACGACFGACATTARQRNADGSATYSRDRCAACGACAKTCYAEALTLVGREMSADQVLREVLEDREFYAQSGGGVTLSGGEPLRQGDFCLELLRLCRSHGLHTAIETNLASPWEQIAAILPLLDLLIFDLKLFDGERHRRWTGVSNGAILTNVRRLEDYLSNAGGNGTERALSIIVRTPVIAGVNDDADEIAAIARVDRPIARTALLRAAALPPSWHGQVRKPGATTARCRSEAPVARAPRIARGHCPPSRPRSPNTPREESQRMIAAPLTYRHRIDMLRATKVAQTRAKIAANGSMDHDDHGIILPPDGFVFHAQPNHPSGGFFGPAGMGGNFRALLEAMPTYVDPIDGLAGRMRAYLGHFRKVYWNPDFSFAPLHDDMRRYGIVNGIGAGQHFAPDLQMGLELGWGGLLDKIRRHRAKHGPDKAEFYQSLEDIILGVQNWIGRTIVDIRGAAESEGRPEIREDLCELAEANEWILGHPPRTFREACQWLAWYMMAARIYNGDGAGGHLDQLLWPYYERDIAAGRLDDEKAIFLIASPPALRHALPPAQRRWPPMGET